MAVISLGAGFDTRSIRFANDMAHGDEIQAQGVDFFELDLPEVIAQKRGLFERYSRRKPAHILPNLVETNLNDFQAIDKALAVSVFRDEDTNGEPRSDGGTRYKKVILLAEAVLMYVEKDKVAPMLKMIINSAKCHAGSVSFVFSDRFPGVNEQLDQVTASVDNASIAEKEQILVQNYLFEIDNRLNLEEWLPKPGRARHQGVSRVVSRRNLDEQYPRLQGYALL